jgi:lipopolysaccharide transport system ATP-binding protein
MTNDIAIRVENLSKCYHIYDQPRHRLLQMMFRGHKQFYREFWALKDVSFQVKKGETVGIIGRNGSGKSTLLQMICGTLNPTQGSIQTKGRIAALLELGSGFNPEFSGRENIYTSCALLGLNRQATDARFDDIVAFADIGGFIEQPVKTYSSGMFVRLAFAVNVIASPDIMVVDEALAVGDMNFQAKCMTALTRFQENGGTVLFVSHDVGAVKSLCRQAVYLEHGRVVSKGAAPEVAERYVRAMREEMSEEARKHSRVSASFVSNDQKLPVIDVEQEKGSRSASQIATDTAGMTFKSSKKFDQQVGPFRYGMGGAIIRYVELLDLSDQPVVLAEFDQRVKIRIHFEVHQETELSINYYIQDDNKSLIVGAALRTLGSPMLQCCSGDRYIVTYSTNLPLQEGNYSIQVQLTRPVVPDEVADFIDVIDNAVVFNVARRASGRLWTKVYLDNDLKVAAV